MEVYKFGDLALNRKDKWSGKIVGITDKFIFVLDARRTLATRKKIPGISNTSLVGKCRIFDRDKFEANIAKGNIIIFNTEG